MTIPAVEWLETDGLGGFASGTAAGLRTRRYHGVLLAATTPPTGRMMLVNGFEVRVETRGRSEAISSQRYAPGVTHPDGLDRLVAFTNDPWPRWVYRLDDGAEIEHELFVPRGSSTSVACWRLRGDASGRTLLVRPLLSGRDYHATHHENGAFRFDASIDGGSITWRPYADVPAVTAISNGRYIYQPDWYRNFLYEEERARGLDDVEDLGSPGTLAFDLQREAALILTADPDMVHAGGAEAQVSRLRRDERARRAFPSVLHRGADAYLVRRGAGSTIIAGYPWFTDWGRDTFIALRGLCLASGRLTEAREILLAWAGAVSEGMLPNRFPDRGDAPEFNSVDASLWYVIAVQDFLDAVGSRRALLSSPDRQALGAAVEAIVEGYARGTRYGIRMDADGLLACGAPGVQLTWMDAKIGDWVVTPRTGKPVEIQALWLNALRIASRSSRRWKGPFDRGMRSFRARFWNAEGGLFDVVDVDHRPGVVDATCRPNQIFAVGGLPMTLLAPPMAAQVVDAVERRLLTPMGLRSLAPGEPGYAGRYEGNGAERDARYHQGTVWPWLMGPFVEAWVRVRGPSPEVRREARDRFLAPLLALAASNGGHIPEIVDADPPHTPRGCPCQAWSVGETLRSLRNLRALPTIEAACSTRCDATGRNT